MNVIRYSIGFIMIASTLGINAKLVGPGDISLVDAKNGYERFINDSIVNRTNKDLVVQVQFLKVIDQGYSIAKEDLKKYASQEQIIRTAAFTIAPAQELKFFEAFIKNNPLNSKKEYWIPQEVKIKISQAVTNTNKEQNLMVTLKLGIDLLNEVIKSKKHIVSIVDNQLQVATENKVIN